MPELIFPPYLLDSTGGRASGELVARATTTFEVDGDVILPVAAHGVIEDGIVRRPGNGGPFSLPELPEGVAMHIVMELDERENGGPSKRRIFRTVSYPNTATIMWTDLVDVEAELPEGSYVLPEWAGILDTKANAAIAASDTAVTAAAAAVAVGSTNDTIIAGRINTPGSATATALSTTLTPQFSQRRFPATADAFNAPIRVGVGLVAIGVTTSVPGTFLVQSGTILRWSPNFGTNLNNATIPTNTGEFQYVYEWNGYVYLIAKDWADNLYKVYRAISPTLADPTLEWSAALLTLTTGANASAPSITATANALVICEQGDPVIATVKAANIWRTTNGTTFTAVKTLPSTYRHFHCVAADPFNPGHIWATSGDNLNNCFHRSTDHGATWTDLAIPMAWQTVQISFTADLVYLAPDAVGIAPLYVLDRATLAIKVGSYDSHRNARVMEPGAYVSGNPVNASTTYGTTEPVFVSTDVGRRIMGTHIPNNTTIVTFSNSKQVILSAAATSAATNAIFAVERPERPRSVAFLGAVDPATGIYYGVTNNDLGGATGIYGRPILFMVPFPGGPVVSLGDLVDAASPAVFINQGRVWFGSYSRPLITLA